MTASEDGPCFGAGERGGAEGAESCPRWLCGGKEKARNSPARWQTQREEGLESLMS